MIHYRSANKNDIDQLSKIVAESFGEYPLFDIVLRDKFKSIQDYVAFTTLIHKVNLKISIKKHVCIVGVRDSKICSMTILERPEAPEVDIFDYIRAGGLQLITQIGLLKLLEMKRIAEEVRKEIIRRHQDAWYVEILSVNKAYQGQQLGSRMIEECIVPYVKEHGGKKVTLITNTEANRKFYIKNGFSELFGESIRKGKKEFQNWGYLRNIV